MGQRIKIKYEATTNHLGYFLTKLCKNDNVKRDPAQSCFDATVLKTPEGKTTYPMKGPIGISKGYGGNGKQWHEWYVVLPQGITCEQCILQVSSFFPKHVRTKVSFFHTILLVSSNVDFTYFLLLIIMQVDWKAGNQGPCFDLEQCRGRGAEHFVTCSDIRIKSDESNPTKGKCPKTHKYAYNNGRFCCLTNKDCKDNPLTMLSECCQYHAFKECPSKKCERMSDPPCKDDRKHCAYWETQGHCTQSHVRFMKKHCKKSCGVC